MKKTLLLLIISTFIWNQAQAQKIGVGVKAGLNYATLNGSDAKDLDPAFKYHAGLTLRAGLAKTVFLQPELLYSVKGTSTDDVDLDLSYVDIPIVLKVKLADILSVHAGPQFGYLLSADRSSDGGGESDVKDRYKDFDISAVIGAEFESVSGLSFGLRYCLGLSSIGEDYEESVTTTTAGITTVTKVKEDAPELKNGVFQLFAAFTF